MTKEQIVVQINPDVKPSGSDLAVVQAARRSFGKRSDWVPCGAESDYPGAITQWVDIGNLASVPMYLKESDKRLLEFLARGMTANDFEVFKSEVGDAVHYEYKHDGETDLLDLLWQWRNTPTHDTPFNHCFISFEVKAPIFVARHLVKTEYTIMSEYSRRYITDNIEFYVHDYREAAKDKKQGSGGLHPDNEHYQRVIHLKNMEALKTYNDLISSGVAPEQARGHLPQDLMTSWTWSGTLGAMAKMCRERLGSDAQKETRYVAEQVHDYLKEYYPVSAKCLVEGC